MRPQIALPAIVTRNCYDRQVNTAPESIKPSLSRADELSHHGVDLLAAGDAIAAAQSFREAIAADPAHIEAHHGLIRALCDTAQFEAAVAAALALIVLTPGDPLAHTSLSIALQQAGHIPEAEAAAGRARILEWKQQLAEPSETKATN
jgi:Flp pilus assembly protein TadD